MFDWTKGLKARIHLLANHIEPVVRGFGFVAPALCIKRKVGQAAHATRELLLEVRILLGSKAGLTGQQRRDGAQCRPRREREWIGSTSSVTGAYSEPFHERLPRLALRINGSSTLAESSIRRANEAGDARIDLTRFILNYSAYLDYRRITAPRIPTTF